VADPDHALLVAGPEAQPVVRARSSQERDRDRSGQKGDHEHVALERGDARPALRERHGEQEREEDRDAGKYDAQLVQQLDELAIRPLLRRLVVARRIPFHAWTLLRRAARVKGLLQNGRIDAYMRLSNRLDAAHRPLL